MKHKKLHGNYNHLCSKPELQTGNGTAEQAEILLSHIEALTLNYKEVINLYYMEGVPIKDIKTMIGMSESTVRNRLGYGLFLLKKRLHKMKSSL